MSYCQVCGDERHGVVYRSAQRQTLCRSCWQTTPRKVGHTAFDKRYWPAGEDVPRAIRRDFYEDYLRSTHNLSEYVKATTESV